MVVVKISVSKLLEATTANALIQSLAWHQTNVTALVRSAAKLLFVCVLISKIVAEINFVSIHYFMCCSVYATVVVIGALIVCLSALYNSRGSGSLLRPG